MIRLTIDNHAAAVPEGATLLDAAAALGVAIPTLCHLPGRPAVTSCMVCVVKVRGRASLLPACGTVAEEGMVVQTNTEEVLAARRTALELLLSDHVGDCMGPCHVTCPAHMDIPRMIRQIAAGELAEALVTVKRDIALPAVLGRICPAPCEKACRRGRIDAPVSICLLKRYVGDVGLAAAQPWTPPRAPDSGRKAAIVGAGPAGLAAAYCLLQLGHACTVFDDQLAPGGRLRDFIGPERLPPEVLDAEIDIVRRLGAIFRPQQRVGRDISLADLRRDFDAVLIAVGTLDAAAAEALGLPHGPRGLEVDRATYATPREGVFAAGGAIRPASKLAIRALADGKEAAACIDRFLNRGRYPISAAAPAFNSRIGRLLDGEAEAFLTGASREARVEPARGPACGFADQEARREALRCLHCDCHKADACKLRDLSGAYETRQARFAGPRRAFLQQADHDEIIYEPGKCIDCGICIRIATEHKEALGLSFIGRGFDVRVAVPFHQSLAEGLKLAAAQCADACPTGALARKMK